MSRKYPIIISTTVTHFMKNLLDNEMESSNRALAPILREALYEYFGVEEEETVMVRMTPDLAAKLAKIGYIQS